MGRIFGAVTDQTGGAVVGAAVSVVDVARGITRPLVTDAAGQYDASALIPGTYTVRAEAKGFKAEEHSGIEVGVGKEVRVDLTLQPGEQTTTVTVTGDLPSINTTNAQLTTTLENVAVTELPMNGRNYQYLAWTRPGVVMTPTEGQEDFTTDGMSVNYVVFMFDGINDSNLLVGGPSNAGGAETAPAGGLDEQTIVPADAILEVNTGTSTFPAEYGEKPGAHIDVGFKSGTNALHGTATAFGRDTGLNAKNPFLSTAPGAAPLPKSPLTLEQFSGSLGGPIKKDKMFFFADYEGQRYTAGVPGLKNQPTTADLSLPQYNLTATQQQTFSIPDAIFALANTAGSAPPNPLSLNLGGCSALTTALGGTLGTGGTAAFTNGQLATLRGMNTSQIAADCSPNPLINVFGNGNTPTGGLAPGQIVTDFNTNGGSNNGIIKIDWHPNDKNSFNFDWYSGGGDTTSAATFSQQYYSADFHTWANFGRAVWVWTPNATWLNEARFGYDYGNFPDYSHECDHPGSGPNYASLGFVDGDRQCSYESGGQGRDIWGGFPIMTVTGFNATGGSVTMQDNFGNAYTFIDNVSWTHGTHVIKFGTEIRLPYLNAAAMTDNQGTLNFQSSAATPNAFSGATPLENYEAGLVSNGVLLDGDPNRKEFLPTMGFYIQDTWRATPRLTVSYGLRYEYDWPWSNPSKNPSAPGLPPQPAHLWGNFNPSLGTATDLLQETPGHDVFAVYPWNFEPRLGIAWDMFGTGKTVLHAGISVMQASFIYGLQTVYSGGAELNAIPTGFAFYDAAYTGCIIANQPAAAQATACNNGAAVPGSNPGVAFNYLGAPATGLTANSPVNIPANTIQTTTVSFSSPGGTGAGAQSALPFTVGNAVYPCEAGAINCTPPAAGQFNPAFTCGDGNVYAEPNGTLFKPAFCSPQVISPIYHNPYYLLYSMSLQHAFTNNWTIDLAYVGNTADELSGSININTPTPGGNTAGGCNVVGGNLNSPIEQCRRPYEGLFPFYQNIILETMFQHANYNALQASVTHRLSHGLQITPSFTWQHTLSDGANENPYDPQLSWGSSGSPIDFTVTGTYYIPSIKTPAQLLEGWEVNGTVYALSGAATTITDSTDDLIGNGQSDTWDITGNPRSFKLGSVGHPIPCYGLAGGTFAGSSNCRTVSAPGGFAGPCYTNFNPITNKAILAITGANAPMCAQNLPAACINAAANAPTNPNTAGQKNSTGLWALDNIGCYVTGNPISPQGVLTPPAQGTFGNEGYGTMYGHGFKNFDFSVLKNWKFKERYGIQFRAEFYNVLNRTLIYGAGGTSANLPATIGQILNTTDSANAVLGNGPRKIQLGLKLTW